MAHHDQVEKLLRHGYVPLPVAGKVWIDKYQGKPLRYLESAPDPELTRAAFRENLNCGISVTAPYLRNLDIKLVGIDVDCDNPVIIDRVARIIYRPCPAKRGRRGMTFFATFSGEVLLKTDYEKRRGVKVASWLGEASVKTIEPPSDPRAKVDHIDLICRGPYYHSVLPPSIHPDTGQPYEWVPFPGTSTVLKLEDVAPLDLPHLDSAQLALLALCFNPNLKAIWEFIDATGPGDFNKRMVDGTLALYHEYFTIDEISSLALREARRDPPDSKTLREREAAIKGAIRDLPAKFPERNPTPSGKPKRISPDRVYADWLLREIGIENCALSNGAPYI